MTETARLARIAAAHEQEQLGGGIVSGYCIECDRIWPCPTYVWASKDRDVLATWDPDDDDKES
jgi:hypothetical protein